MRLAWLFVVVAVVGCKKHEWEDKPAGPPPPGPGDGGTGAAPVRADAAEPEQAHTKYGYCTVVVRGDRELDARAGLEAGAVASGYWTAGVTAPFDIACKDAASGAEIRFQLPGAKLSDVPQAPADFTYAPEPKPGAISADFALGGAPLTPLTGALHVLRFERNELEATWSFYLDSSAQPPEKLHVSGSIVYHCADCAK